MTIDDKGGFINLKSAKIKNCMVFDKITIIFCDGINVLIGENALLVEAKTYCSNAANKDD